MYPNNIGFSQSTGYPGQNPSYPNQNSSYPNQNLNYPNQNPGYQNQNLGYPNQNPSYLNQNPGFPNQNPSYPNQNPGFPNQNSSYPNQNLSYPVQNPGYPGQNPSYPNQNSSYPNQNPSYPNQNPSYPNQNPSYPNQNPSYPNQNPSYPNQELCHSTPNQYLNSQNITKQTIDPFFYINQLKQMNLIPTIRPNPNFNANATAEMLKKAMKGFGCDKNKVIQALCTISNVQRKEVIDAFKLLYGKNIINELKSELNGDFENLIIALMTPSAEYDANELNAAMKGIGTKESVLIEILTSRTGPQIKFLTNVYQQLFGSLEKQIISETSGYFQRLLVSLSTGLRNESPYVDQLKANQDAHALHKAGVQKLGTDESTFISILASQNFNQLRAVFDEYKKISGHAIEEAIISEFSGDIKEALIAIVKNIMNQYAYFAELIYNSMKGFGTRDSDLIRLIVTRSEIDLGNIRDVYYQKYKVKLEKAIADDCSGSYKDGLIALVRGN